MMTSIAQRGRFVLAAAALAVVAALVVPSSSVAAPHQPTNQTLTLLGKRTAFTLPAAPAVGVGFMAGGDLYDSTGTTKLGTGYSSCTVVAISVAVPPVITAECTSVFRLSGGDIYLGSLRDYLSGDFSNAKLAVLGGTDSYNDARGDGTASVVDPAAHSYTFTITLLS